MTQRIQHVLQMCNLLIANDLETEWFQISAL